MTFLQIFILGLIQGAAELLPVSSSAHVIIAQKLMGLDPGAPEMTFLLVMLHTGTMFAVIIYFWSRWKLLLSQNGGRIPGSEPTENNVPGLSGPGITFLKWVGIATVFTGVIGLGLKIIIEKIVLEKMLGHSKAEVEHLFRNMPLIGTALFLVGVFIVFAGRQEKTSSSNVLTRFQALVIGVVQGLCLPFRGFSRSGATISTALFFGISRTLAEDFSFALAVVLTPPVIFLELHRLLKAKAIDNNFSLGALLMPGMLGMACSFVAGLFALRFLSSALEKGRWKLFGYYCFVAAGFVFFLHFKQ